LIKKKYAGIAKILISEFAYIWKKTFGKNSAVIKTIKVDKTVCINKLLRQMISKEIDEPSTNHPWKNHRSLMLYCYLLASCNNLEGFSVSFVRILEINPSCFFLFQINLVGRNKCYFHSRKKALSIKHYYNTNFHTLGFVISVYSLLAKFLLKKKHEYTQTPAKARLKIRSRIRYIPFGNSIITEAATIRYINRVCILVFHDILHLNSDDSISPMIRCELIFKVFTKVNSLSVRCSL
jgi:hypothetical protein